MIPLVSLASGAMCVLVFAGCAAQTTGNQSNVSNSQLSPRQPTANQQTLRRISERLRRDLPAVIEVSRAAAGSDDVWIARVRSDARDTSGIAVFNAAAPHFIAWMLNNARVDHRTLLTSLPPNAPALDILLDSLAADSVFTRTLSIEIGLFRGTTHTIGGRSEFLFDDLVTFATRFFLLEADARTGVGYSLASTSAQLREIPFRQTRGMEAWFYSFLRPNSGLESLPATRAIIRDVIESAPLHPARQSLDSLERIMWHRLSAEPEFRQHVKKELDRNIKARLFSYRMVPGRPWVDALIASYPGTVMHISDSIRTLFKLDTSFYRKYVNAGGIPVVASAKVPDEALLVARDIIDHMLLARADIRADLIKRHARLGVNATSDSLLDIPEYRNWDKPSRRDKRLTEFERASYDQPGGIGSMSARQYWNNRARGMGGTFTTTSEESLLGYPGSRDFGWALTVHEFAHNIHSSLKRIDAILARDIEHAYREAMARKLYRTASGQKSGGANTVDEYFAEGTQFWFWDNASRVFVSDGIEHTVWSPDDLEKYDPKLYAILSRVYADHHIPADAYHAWRWR